MIRGITFDAQNVQSLDDAILRNAIYSKLDGIIKGCEVTSDTDNIYVASGYFMTQGRLTSITGTETITPEGVTSGTVYGLVVYEIDLDKTNTSTDFNQGTFKVLTSTSTYPTPTKEDIEGTGKVYQMPFAIFTASVSGLANVTNQTTVLTSKHLSANDYTDTDKDNLDGLLDGSVVAKKATSDASGNVITETYLPKSGGTLTGTLNFTATNTNASIIPYAGVLYLRNRQDVTNDYYTDLKVEKGKVNVTVKSSTGTTNSEVLHTGNSKKVVVSDTAPSDTTALWVY